MSQILSMDVLRSQYSTESQDAGTFGTYPIYTIINDEIRRDNVYKLLTNPSFYADLATLGGEFFSQFKDSRLKEYSHIAKMLAPFAFVDLTAQMCTLQKYNELDNLDPMFYFGYVKTMCTAVQVIAYLVSSIALTAITEFMVGLEHVTSILEDSAKLGMTFGTIAALNRVESKDLCTVARSLLDICFRTICLGYSCFSKRAEMFVKLSGFLLFLIEELAFESSHRKMSMEFSGLNYRAALKAGQA